MENLGQTPVQILGQISGQVPLDVAGPMAASHTITLI